MKSIILDSSKYQNMSINDFYELVAKEVGYKVTEDTRFDCTQICVGIDIQTSIFDYYKSKGEDAVGVGMIWVCYGPKCETDLKRNEVVFSEKFMKEV